MICELGQRLEDRVSCQKPRPEAFGQYQSVENRSSVLESRFVGAIFRCPHPHG